MAIAFCVSGKGRLVEALFEAKRAGLIELDGATAVLDRNSEFEETCRRHGVPLHVVRRDDFATVEDFRRSLADILLGLDVDALLLTFAWLLPPEVVARFSPRAVNLHMSLLPLFTGFGAVEAALRSGMKFSGVTYHHVDDSVDMGRIIAQGTTPIVEGMTADELGRALFFRAVPLGIQVVRWLERGEIEDGPIRAAVNAPAPDSPFSPAVDVDILDFSRHYLQTRYG